jgi:hypothetical protein
LAQANTTSAGDFFDDAGPGAFVPDTTKDRNTVKITRNRTISPNLDLEGTLLTTRRDSWA